jgi:hypothetical protein
MGVLDIIYDIFKEYNASIKQEEVRQELAKRAYKQIFSLFYYDWITFRDAGVRANFTFYIDRILQKYATVMVQMIPEIGNSLSTVQKNKLVEFITELRRISATIEVSEMNEIIEQVNQCAEKAKTIFEGL